MKDELKILLSVFIIAFMLKSPAYGTAWESAAKIEKGYKLTNCFQIIDGVVVPAAEKCKMTVILVNHYDRTLSDANFGAEIPRICGQWKFLTQLYANLPHDRYFFELRNEQTNEISNENLRIVQQAIIDTIRNYDTERILIVEANEGNIPWNLSQTSPYKDPQNNIIYALHSYSPHNLPIEAKNWSQTYNVPIYRGQSGVSWFTDAVERRCNYIKFITQIANELSIPWIYSDIKNSHDAFGIFKNDIIHEDNLISCFEDALELEYRVACNAALLAEVIGFKGTEDDCTIRLNWHTETEKNMDYYEIQKSTDTHDFRSAGRITAADNTSERRDYTFTDKTIGEQNYYRIKAVNLDGSYKYSETIHIKSSCYKGSTVDIYPNPVRPNQLLNIRIDAKASAKATIEIINIFGQIIRQTEHYLHKGINTIPYPTDDIYCGNYFIRLIGTGWSPETQKFIKLQH